VSSFRLNTLVVVGVGLIGGSVALALKRAGAVARVIGVGRGNANIARARELNVIDEVAADLSAAAEEADMVLIAVPVRQNAHILGQLRDAVQRGVVVTDAGSTKQDFVAAAREMLGAGASGVVPGHPIAGAELTGVEAASAALFEGRRVVLTPLPESRAAAVDMVESMWRSCGAQVTRMTAERHDAVFSAVSHLPHVLAFTLVEMIASRTDAEELFSFAASGFRDFTRIAGSSAEMWRDICMANADALVADIEAFRKSLAEVTAQLHAGDGQALQRMFESARAAREAWLRKTP